MPWRDQSWPTLHAAAILRRRGYRRYSPRPVVLLRAHVLVFPPRRSVFGRLMMSTLVCVQPNPSEGARCRRGSRWRASCRRDDPVTSMSGGALQRQASRRNHALYRPLSVRGARGDRTSWAATRLRRVRIRERTMRILTRKQRVIGHLVEPRGFEPLTSAVRLRRSPS